MGTGTATETETEIRGVATGTAEQQVSGTLAEGRRRAVAEAAASCSSEKALNRTAQSGILSAEVMTVPTATAKRRHS
jgi:hypothetical protein